MKEDLVLYILMRDDLPSLNPGKMAAQAAHASNQFIHQYLDGSESKRIESQIKEWQSCASGFGTTIVLSVSEQDINDIINIGSKYYLACDKVIDPTYPFIVDRETYDCIDKTKLTTAPFFTSDDNVVLCREEITCGFIFGDKSDPVLRFLTNKYKLYR